jgi:hypothetical protein
LAVTRTTLPASALAGSWPAPDSGIATIAKSPAAAASAGVAALAEAAARRAMR